MNKDAGYDFAIEHRFDWEGIVYSNKWNEYPKAIFKTICNSLKQSVKALQNEVGDCKNHYHFSVVDYYQNQGPCRYDLWFISEKTQAILGLQNA